MKKLLVTLALGASSFSAFAITPLWLRDVNISPDGKEIVFCYKGDIYKVKAAKSEARITQYQLDNAKEKIELQVNQSAFKVNEAAKTLIMAEKNLEKANENLRYATLGFEEGVIPASNVLEAHTAWLSAQSEKIDAQIDVKLTEIYLKKATGNLQFDNLRSGD